MTVKRFLDVLGALSGLILLAPLFLLLFVLIRLSSPGPAFYRQERIGRGGKPFQILKFRTMYDGADLYLPGDVENAPLERLNWDYYQKLLHDPRLTRIGGALRRTSLDELPQMWNVLLGEMSLVGPRPILPEQSEFYGPGLDQYIKVSPGMTGLWQVSGRNRLSFRERANCDLDYLEHWSLGLDFRILIRTVFVVIKGDGAY